jgi:hypothetical protein
MFKTLRQEVIENRSPQSLRGCQNFLSTIAAIFAGVRLEILTGIFGYKYSGFFVPRKNRQMLKFWIYNGISPVVLMYQAIESLFSGLNFGLKFRA